MAQMTPRRRLLFATIVAAWAAMLIEPLGQRAAAATLDRVKEMKKLRLGYRADAQPLSFDDAGKPAGYSVALCQLIADQMKADLSLADLAVEWVAVTPDDRFAALKDGKIDLLCGASTATLARRKEVSFSIPIFPSGIGALLRADAPAALRLILSVGQPPSTPVWRGSPARTVLEKRTYSVVKGTTAESWLPERIKAFEIDASVAPVASYDAGVQSVLGRTSDVLFGDRAILRGAVKRSSSGEDLVLIDRFFTYEPVALALPRDDEDLRLLVDRKLSQTFRSADFPSIYGKWFGSPDEAAADFFQLSALPD
jgi:polar amino acid transport system substrate-binding protein